MRCCNCGQSKKHLVRIKYWRQDTVESGHWELTGLMKEILAKKVLSSFDLGEIHIDDACDFSPLES